METEKTQPVATRIGPKARLLFISLGSACATATLIFSLLFATLDPSNPETANLNPVYLGLAFVFLCLLGVVCAFYPPFRKARFHHLFLAGVSLTLSVFSFLMILQPWFLKIVASGYCFGYAVSRLFEALRLRSKRAWILNGLSMAFFLLLGGVFASLSFDEPDSITLMALVLGLILAISSFGVVVMLVLSQIRKGVLIKILKQSYAAEILIGLLILIIASSAVLAINESSIGNFGDALWYCFAVVTTIGFGDFTAHSILGRVISVMLGIYGIIVVALITSIIVNFYNETTANHPKPELPEKKPRKKKKKEAEESEENEEEPQEAEEEPAPEEENNE